jgi:hypothetical protein
MSTKTTKLYKKGVTITSSTTLAFSPNTAFNEVVEVDATAGNIIITLPPLTDTVYRRILFTRLDASSNPVSILSPDSIINSAASVSLATQFQGIVLYNDGAKWINPQNSTTSTTAGASYQTIEKYEFVPTTLTAGTYFDTSSNFGTYFIQVPAGKTCTLEALKGYITEGTSTSAVTLNFKKNGANFATFSIPAGATIGARNSTFSATTFADGDQISVQVIGSDTNIGFVSFLTIKLI